MRTGIEFAHKISLAYSAMCKPLCHQINLPQTAFDILMFLSNNPEFTTARDIVEIRKIKANLVSVNVVIKSTINANKISKNFTTTLSCRFFAFLLLYCFNYIFLKLYYSSIILVF